MDALNALGFVGDADGISKFPGFFAFAVCCVRLNQRPNQATIGRGAVVSFCHWWLFP